MQDAQNHSTLCRWTSGGEQRSGDERTQFQGWVEEREREKACWEQTERLKMWGAGVSLCWQK